MANLIAIFLGAGTGGLLRYILSSVTMREYHGHFPLGTFLCNVIGCFAIGYLATFFLQVMPTRESWRLGITVGLLGGFTTFSSFSRETFELLGAGRSVIAMWYVLASNLLGLALAFSGHVLAKSLHP